MSETEQAEQAKLLKLDSLRRSSGIHIDHRGRWWHHGTAFEHPRVIQALNHGLQWRHTERREVDHLSSVTHTSSNTSSGNSWSGEATIHIGGQWCYVGCELTPFLILKIRGDENAGTLDVLLNTGERFHLGDLSLRNEILFSRLSLDRFARFSASAQLQIEPWLTEDDDPSRRGELCLAYAQQRWPISIEPHE